MNKKVYLAGSMAGLTEDAVRGWRHKAAARLRSAGVEPLDPCRQTFNSGLPRTKKSILWRDYKDCTDADLLIVGYPEPPKNGAGSLGTAMEIAWAWHLKIPILVWAGTKDIPDLRHPMIAGCLAFVSFDLDRVLDEALSYLNVYN